MKFKFQMKFNGETVAECSASAVLTYGFQMHFYESIGYVEHMQGKPSALDSLISRKVGEYDSWVAVGVDDAVFSFYCERVD